MITNPLDTLGGAEKAPATPVQGALAGGGSFELRKGTKRKVERMKTFEEYQSAVNTGEVLLKTGLLYKCVADGPQGVFCTIYATPGTQPGDINDTKRTLRNIGDITGFKVVQVSAAWQMAAEVKQDEQGKGS
jgi:hypothetical protein